VILVGGGVVWSTRRGVQSYCKSLNMREEGTGKVCGGGVGGEDFGQKVRTHARKLAEGATKGQAPSSRGFLRLRYQGPAGRKERQWRGFNLDSKDLNLDQTSRKTLGSH
jgi:hypothetical protein